MWRKISDDVKELHYASFSFFIDDSIYMFGAFGRNSRYSIVDRQVHELSQFMTARSHHVVVNLEGTIYALGGITYDGEIFSVEVYDSDLDLWYPTAEMIPIWPFVAEPLNNHIYVVGERSNDEGLFGEMIAQVFDASTKTWSLLPAVPTERSDAVLVSYMEKIYVIGGHTRESGRLRVVEVFDPAQNEWSIGTSLPYKYYDPKAIVFQDLLIVYDRALILDSQYVPPVFYNNEEERWERFEESSPFYKAYSYRFFKIEKEECIDILTRENRQPDLQLEKSPFALN